MQRLKPFVDLYGLKMIVCARLNFAGNNGLVPVFEYYYEIGTGSLLSPAKFRRVVDNCMAPTLNSIGYFRLYVNFSSPVTTLIINWSAKYEPIATAAPSTAHTTVS